MLAKQRGGREVLQHMASWVQRPAIIGSLAYVTENRTFFIYMLQQGLWTNHPRDIREALYDFFTQKKNQLKSTFWRDVLVKALSGKKPESYLGWLKQKGEIY